MAQKQILLTEKGIEELKEEFRHLLDVESPKNKEALAAARAQGDLSENADYDAARQRQAEIEARIQEIQQTLDHARVAEIGSKISIGYTVTYVEEATGEETTVSIVGSVEADPLAEPYPEISNECPLGAALNGHSQGDRVLVESDEPYWITITSALVQR